jgi:hypothetical protein
LGGVLAGPFRFCCDGSGAATGSFDAEGEASTAAARTAVCGVADELEEEEEEERLEGCKGRGAAAGRREVEASDRNGMLQQLTGRAKRGRRRRNDMRRDGCGKERLRSRDGVEGRSFEGC